VTDKEFSLNKPTNLMDNSHQDGGDSRQETKTENEIWVAFINGDDNAFATIYNNYVQQLFRFGIQFAPREVVKDAIQDLFLYLKRRKWRGEKVNRIAPYLYKSLYRILNDKVKKDHQLKSFDFDQKLVSNWEINISVELQMIENENSEKQATLLKKSLTQLSPKQRQAILLYYYEGFTYEEIKEIMQLNHRSSVRKLIHRALESLRNVFTTLLLLISI